MHTNKIFFPVIAVLILAIFVACPGPLMPDPPGGSDEPTCPPCTPPDPELTVSSPALADAEAGQSYQFTFTATNLPSNLNEVVFAWTFGTGLTGSSGTQQVTVSGGQATHQVTYTYPNDGMYALVVVVEDTDGETILTENVTVVVGEPQERDFDLDICNTWRAATQGGQGVTVDVWDISDLPVGAEFDMLFDAYGIPDKYVVEYNGVVVLDTGWRGNSSYEGNPMYPGGIAGPGSGQEDGIFTKVAGVNTFTVTVFGPQSGTAWNYSIRANCN